MNKLVKGAIATAAGAVLLFGGAGTFAYWNSSTPLTNQTITAGNLVVTGGETAGVWTVQKNGAGTASVINISTFLTSPGDVLTYTKTVTATATGDNLVATLSLGTASITAANGAAASTALATRLTRNAVVVAEGDGVVASGTNTYTLTAGTAGIINRDVKVTVTIAFPNNTTVATGAGVENDAKLGVVSLSGLTVTLNQI